MSKEREIIVMAEALRLPISPDPIASIINFCHDKIQSWSPNWSKINSIADLEVFVCQKLKLKFEEIWTDKDLDQIISKYVQQEEFVFATLIDDLDESTYATLFTLRSLNPREDTKYVAVIDCRGKKESRRFFTKWHEIAHLLTLYNQMELPLHRSQQVVDPLERLMDKIAGEVGFLDQLFLPPLKEETERRGFLTFDGIERIRNIYCQDASFMATLKASISKYDKPAVLIQAGFGFKVEEQRFLDTAFPFFLSETAPEAKIRAIKVEGNPVARKKLGIHRNMEIPSCSLLFKAVTMLKSKGVFPNDTTIENLSTWKTSKGGHLLSNRVSVDVRMFGGEIWSLLSA